jgi:hypothetical protein
MTDKKALILSIKQWLEDYDNNEEHDLDLTIELKDSAYLLLEECFTLLK